MSSTKRGGKRSEADYYATPHWATRRILEALALPSPGRYLDPCAGEGDIIRAAIDHAGKRGARPRWSALEIRPECELPLKACAEHVWIGDSLGPDLITSPDVVLTNPPFRLAMEFVEKYVSTARITIMLLRLNFLGSEDRSGWLRSHMPDIYLLPNRPVFGINKEGVPGTDSIEYGWYVWRGMGERSAGRIEILPSTSIQERQDDPTFLRLVEKSRTDPECLAMQAAARVKRKSGKPEIAET